MNLRMIIALVNDSKTKKIMDAARDAGATGATILNGARGEGLKPEKTFLGLDLAAQRDLVLFLVAAPMARPILEAIAEAGHFDSEPGAGIAVEIGIDDAVGLTTQLPTLLEEVDSKI
ncbi:P-II family nitrogen regulator [Magnetospira sp. QH-2]|uniref:P-II family nitrogen regulator n=1 Tax=Magnetospira sp. (strain QH-2) TaxID=1288970 RepID=UPI0003E80BFC|nr:P-II family nitrogen regulator [Magnetospira sp. QH-2]CCQ75557.1 putative nitrogen regulatory protein P-II like protein [Magnetospira sp. QH-2]